jgi:hypothetical protein
VIAIAVTTALPMTLPAIEMFIFMSTQYYNDGFTYFELSGWWMNFGKTSFKTILRHTKASIYYLKFHDSKDITKFGATMK